MSFKFLDKAIEFAHEVHKNEKDKGGNPYILHPLAVSDMLEDPIDKAIAVLHDVVESDPTSMKKLEDMNAPVEVLDAIKLLTRNLEDSYMDYILKLAESRNIRAIRVKLADISHNTSEERMRNIVNVSLDKAKSLEKRYNKAKGVLEPLYIELISEE